MDNYLGIDYGRGMTNIDHETGIRFGVIPHHKIGSAWAEDSEPVYTFICPHCDADWGTEMNDVCPVCEEEIDPYTDAFDNQDPDLFEICVNGYHMHQSYDDPDVWIEKSPFYTKCQFCSPCAPGAGYLMNHTPDGIKAYCPGPEWFEDNKAPFPIYRVSNDELVNPEFFEEK